MFLEEYDEFDLKYDLNKIPKYTLPDPLKSENGLRINSIEEWTRVQRKKLINLFANNLYGKIPGKFEKFKIITKSVDKNFFNSLATKKEIRIQFNEKIFIDLLIFIPNSGAYFTFGDWQGKCDSEANSCFFTGTFDIEIDSSGELYTYSFMNEENDSFLVYFTLELGVDSLNHFIYDPNILTINYFIPPAYSFSSKTEVYDKINDDFDNIPDNIPDFIPACSGSGQYLGSLFPQFQSR